MLGLQWPVGHVGDRPVSSWTPRAPKVPEEERKRKHCYLKTNTGTMLGGEREAKVGWGQGPRTMVSILVPGFNGACLSRPAPLGSGKMIFLYPFLF